MRQASVSRKTKETDINLSVCFDGKRDISIDTGIGFFDHMLTAFAFHGGLSLTVKAVGDTHVDMHHTVEDVGIVLGQAIKQALGDLSGIQRFSHIYIPMDEALAFCCLDISNRAYLVYNAPMLDNAVMPGFDAQLAEEFFRAVAVNAGLTLHLRAEYGKNPHHIIEALFKALGRSLNMSAFISQNGQTSTKGVL